MNDRFLTDLAESRAYHLRLLRWMRTEQAARSLQGARAGWTAWLLNRLGEGLIALGLALKAQARPRRTAAEAFSRLAE